MNDLLTNIAQVAITAQQFKTEAQDWLTVGVALIVPLTAFAGGVFGFVAFLRGKVQEARLDRHGQSIKELALAMPAPPAPRASSPTTDNQ